jgi:hypothetical protein
MDLAVYSPVFFVIMMQEAHDRPEESNVDGYSADKIHEQLTQITMKVRDLSPLRSVLHYNCVVLSLHLFSCGRIIQIVFSPKEMFV